MACVLFGKGDRATLPDPGVGSAREQLRGCHHHGAEQRVVGSTGIEGGGRAVGSTPLDNCELDNTRGRRIDVEIHHDSDAQAHLVQGVRDPTSEGRVLSGTDFPGWLGGGVAAAVLHSRLRREVGSRESRGGARGSFF